MIIRIPFIHKLIINFWLYHLYCCVMLIFFAFFFFFVGTHCISYLCFCFVSFEWPFVSFVANFTCCRNGSEDEEEECACVEWPKKCQQHKGDKKQQEAAAKKFLEISHCCLKNEIHVHHVAFIHCLELDLHII